jgi:putative transposase
MKGWFTAREIADLCLPGLPGSKRNVNRLAIEQGWATKRTARGEALSRQRELRDGGGLEYHVSLLPPEARTALSVANSKLAAEKPIPQQLPLLPVTADETPRRVLRRDARLAILMLLDAAIKQARNSGTGQTLVAIMEDFALRWNLGDITAEPWIRQELDGVSASSLKRWKKQRDAGEIASVGGAGRKAKSLLDAAQDGEVATRIAAFILKQPFLNAWQLRDLIRAEFGDELLVDGRFVAVPSARSFQRWITDFKTTNKVALLQATNPDKFKSHARFTGTNNYAGYTHVNALWEFDASPADVMLHGGRHAIYMMTDIYSRRVMISVTKSPRTSAALLLIRRAIVTWGVPDEIRTDNGSDFTSRAFVRALASVGIRQDVSTPYSPEEKAIVERVIGTMQRDLMPLLPGFIGHNVADRKQIEERKSFAARMGDTDQNCFCVDLDPEEFQTMLDEWATNKFAERKHAALDMSPREKARSCLVPQRFISNERSLDMLLLPIDGGWRTATKRGIEFQGDYYLAGSILPGTRVFCRQHPDDYGKLVCYEDEHGGAFLGLAECAERMGVDPLHLNAVHKAARAELLKDQLADAKRQARALKPRHLIEKSRELWKRDAMAKAGNVVELPRRNEAHSSPGLEAAAEAVAADEKVFDMDADVIVAQRFNPAPAASNVTRLGDSRELRLKRYRELAARLAAGEALSEEDAFFLGSYQNSPELKAQQRMERDFGN